MRKFILGLFLGLTIGYLATSSWWRAHSGRCPAWIAERQTSPNNGWVASVTEITCESFFFTSIIGAIEVGRVGDPERGATILTVDSGGNRIVFPRFEWRGGDHLHIIVPFDAYFPPDRPTIPHLTITVELESSDPTLQARFRKAMQAAPGIVFTMPPPRDGK